MKGAVMTIHGKLAGRYGSKAATAILASGILAGIPLAAVPGSTLIGMLPGVAIAEAVHQFRKATGLSAEEHEELTPEEMQLIFKHEVARPLREHIKKWADENAEALSGLKEDDVAMSAEAAIEQAEAAGVELSEDVRERVKRIVGERFKA